MTAPRAVIVFDGVCVLCSRSVAWIAAHDRDGVFAFASSGTPGAAALLAPLGLDPDAPGSIVLVDDGRALMRSDAALSIASRLPAPWSWLGVLRLVPRRLRDAAYDLIARHRYRWFGKREMCEIPSDAVRRRLL